MPTCSINGWNLINFSWCRSDPLNSFILQVWFLFLTGPIAWSYLARFIIIFARRPRGGDCSTLQPWEGEDCGGMVLNAVCRIQRTWHGARTFLPLVRDCPTYMNHFGTSGSAFGFETSSNIVWILSCNLIKVQLIEDSCAAALYWSLASNLHFDPDPSMNIDAFWDSRLLLPRWQSCFQWWRHPSKRWCGGSANGMFCLFGWCDFVETNNFWMDHEQ